MTKIIVRLAGGLGNQLFQFAAAFKIAQLLGVGKYNIYLETKYLGGYESKRNFEIDFIVNLFEGVGVAYNYSISSSFIFNTRFAKLFNSRFAYCEFIANEKRLLGLNYTDNTKVIYVDGYFQSPSLIFSEEVRIDLYAKLTQKYRICLSEEKLIKPCIGVHIRRGDYVSSQSASKVFRTIPLEFYKSAISNFVEAYEVLVFSDDKTLAEEFATEIGAINVSSFDLDLKDEFMLLMECDHHVISNSTFSWWAAYLGRKKNGRVISPRNWYVDSMRSDNNPLNLNYFELLDY